MIKSLGRTIISLSRLLHLLTIKSVRNLIMNSTWKLLLDSLVYITPVNSAITLVGVFNSNPIQIAIINFDDCEYTKKQKQELLKELTR